MWKIEIWWYLLLGFFVALIVTELLPQHPISHMMSTLRLGPLHLPAFP